MRNYTRRLIDEFVTKARTELFALFFVRSFRILIRIKDCIKALSIHILYLSQFQICVKLMKNITKCHIFLKLALTLIPNCNNNNHTIYLNKKLTISFTSKIKEYFCLYNIFFNIFTMHKTFNYNTLYF